MGKKGLSIVVAVIVAVIISVIVVDFTSNRPARLGANPYELDVSEYEKVDPSLIHYKETKNIPITGNDPGGMSLSGDHIFITGKNFLQVITIQGIQQLLVELEGDGTCILAEGDDIYIGFNDHIEKYTTAGELVSKWASEGSRSVLTSIAVKDNVLYAADAGNRRVLRYDLAGKLLGEFEGKAESSAGHGFIVPSPNFDLVTNSFGELWVVNPGKHALENYTDDGVLRGYWENISMDIDGFTGCCNPAEIAVMPDGSFITSEKGLVRIKVHDQSGKLLSVVAPPNKFEKDGKAPEVAVDDNGVVYALDFDRKIIRIFEKSQ